MPFILILCGVLDLSFAHSQYESHALRESGLSAKTSTKALIHAQSSKSTRQWKKLEESKRSDNRLNQSVTLSNRALTHQQNGQFDKAQQAIAQSLTILRSLPETPEQQRIYAASLDIQGHIQNTQGSPALALETWKQAEQIYQDQNFPELLTNNQINQAIAMQQLGLYPRACQTLLQSLGQPNPSCPLDEESLTTLASQTPDETSDRARRQLGSVLAFMGYLNQAQQIFIQAAQQAPIQSQPDTVANLYLNLGNTARAQGIRLAEISPKNTEESLSNMECLSPLPETVAGAFQQSAACYQNAIEQGNDKIKLQAQLNLASLVSESQHFLASSSPLTTQDISLSPLQSQLDQLPNSHEAVMTRLKWVQTNLCLTAQSTPDTTAVVSPVLQQCTRSAPGASSQASTAQDIYTVLERVPLSDIEKQATIALRQAQAINDPKAVATSLGYLGAIALQQNQPQQGQTYTEQALQQVSAYDSPEINYLWLWQLGRIYQHQGQTQDAIAAYQSSQQILENLRGDLVTATPDVQFAFRDGVEPVYRELVNLLLPDENPSQRNLAQAREVIESLQLAELHNFYQQACLKAQPQPIEKVDKKAAVIYAITLDDRLAVVTSIPNQPLTYHSVDFSEQGQAPKPGDIAVDETVANLRSCITPFVSCLDPLKANRQLYDWLVRPDIAALQDSQIKTLVFVLDGTLRSVPVAALHDGQQYLIEQYNVALTPGLQLLSPRALTDQEPKTLAAGLVESRRGYSALPGVQEEVNNIAEIVPTEILLNDTFTSQSLEQSIQDVPYNIVHLATHAEFSSQADQTFLLAWDKNINVNNLDTVLRQRERQLANRPIELLILSACQTATGDKRAALGLAGVAMRSGARSTLATLWSVQDQSTAKFMTQFYEALNKPGLSKADALRQAQLELLRSPNYQSPYYWAPFVLVGNWL